MRFFEELVRSSWIGSKGGLRQGLKVSCRLEDAKHRDMNLGDLHLDHLRLRKLREEVFVRSGLNSPALSISSSMYHVGGPMPVANGFVIECSIWKKFNHSGVEIAVQNRTQKQNA